MSDRRQRILVVEDDAAIRTMEERILTASGFEVRCASNGTEAFGIAREGSYDLFLLDVMMPGMNGLELARALRADDLTKDTPILFATAKGEPDMVAEGFQAGASLYLIKPFTTSTLLTMVRAAVAPVSG
jgi:DNA-binding response OmpR family regulator